jgi:peptide/nickel transport system ATP-binding protein
VVGESGCGKSMTALALLRLIPSPPGRISGGLMRFRGEDLVQASEARMREIRGDRISMIFQEPMTSLNPVFTIGDQIAETLKLHGGLDAQAARVRTIEMLQQVGIPAPEKRVDEYPHQLSGGMRQRVMIAMALACRPDILIADEPTTALDVTVQAQIFDLLRQLQRDKRTAIVLITHDMGVVAEMADRVMVMYAGRVVEQGTTTQVLYAPRHPYTQGLIECLPELGCSQQARRTALTEIPGVVPSIWELGTGCAFRDRCPYAMPRCATDVPPMLGAGGGHGAACWLLQQREAATA